LSDSIVISIDIKAPDSFAKLFMYYGLFVSSMFVEHCPPLMSRGAIAIGEIFQEENIVFGPTLIKAHILESKNAENFRHIIDKEDFCLVYDTGSEDAKNILDGLFYLDKDGYYCYDYLSRYLGYIDNRITRYPDGNIGESALQILTNLHNKFIHEINSNKDKGVVKKYKWFKAYFTKSLRQAIHFSDNDDYLWLKKAHGEWRINKQS